MRLFLHDMYNLKDEVKDILKRYTTPVLKRILFFFLGESKNKRIFLFLN